MRHHKCKTTLALTPSRAPPIYQLHWNMPWAGALTGARRSLLRSLPTPSLQQCRDPLIWPPFLSHPVIHGCFRSKCYLARFVPTSRDAEADHILKRGWPNKATSGLEIICGYFLANSLAILIVGNYSFRSILNRSLIRHNHCWKLLQIKEMSKLSIKPSPCHPEVTWKNIHIHKHWKKWVTFLSYRWII